MDEQQREHIARAAKVMQIIAFAMVCGVATFAVITIFLQSEEKDPNAATINSPLAAGATVLALIAAAVVPKVLAANMRQAIAEGKPFGQNLPAPIDPELGEVGSLTAVYQTKLIVGDAILEGAAFYNLVAYLLEPQTINLACAAMLVVAILFKFPTRSGIESWVLDQQKSIEELRAFEG